jgi:alkaline phosphatase D
VFEDAEATREVASGRFETDASSDFTVHVAVDGLRAGTTYYYRFSHEAFESVLGRTRTAPEGAVERLRFAVVSCASFGHGYYHAYRAIAERLDLDAVIHLGDYIYEYGPGYGDVREYEPARELLTLEDYRTRYAHYRTDPDLLELHRQHPIIAVWDDHETANNAWYEGAENHDDDEGSYPARKRAGQQAYHEWLPIRSDEPERIFRRLSYGDLCDLLLLDTRHFARTRQIDDPEDPEFDAEERTLLGPLQESWLDDEFERSRARWRVVAQQVMVSDLPAALVNTDSWSGYPAARRRLYDTLSRDNGRAVVLTGDIHMSFGLDLVSDLGQALGAEFVTTSVTSPSLEQDLAERALELIDEALSVRFADLWRRGYMLVDVDEERVQAEWYLFERVDRESAEERFAGAACLRQDELNVRAIDEPSEPPPDPPEPAP